MPRIIVSLRGHTLSLSLSLSLSHSPIQTPNPSSSGSLFSYPSRPLVRSQRSYPVIPLVAAPFSLSSSSNCRSPHHHIVVIKSLELSLVPWTLITYQKNISLSLYVSMLIPCLKIWILIVRKRCFTVQDWFDVCYKGYNL
ncbi:uncharacterized protein LOC114312862 isoform X5 [Camellia sinensis]|uniref:uncharacterized protein LOC114312862 isoform X5 n=1 Tax=Camellia sinensis TaxID=4442 RepID=UPI0010363E6F|nr:uncharacterized protein LOC114312862 isoform X5 [Camellia sinensis]